MVRKRGPYDRIEKVVSKKRPVSITEEVPRESASSKKDRNMLNDHILSLYRKEASSYAGSPSSNNNSTSGETDGTATEVKGEQVETTSKLFKASRKSMKVVDNKKYPGFSVKYPTIKLKDVAGLDEILASIFQIFYRLRFPAVFSTLKAERGDFVLLHGPAGCGKTHVVHAIAGEIGLPLLEIAATELVHGVSGESESRIRDIFEESLRIAPCILFIDRIDVIAPKVDLKDSRGMEKRMVTQLVTSLDDFKKNDNSSNVMVIAATNKLDFIDPDLLQRFDHEFIVKIPNEKARLMILQVLTQHMNLPADFDLDWLAHHTPGYVGADLHKLIKKAFYVSVNRMFEKYRNEYLESEKCKSDIDSDDQNHSKSFPEAVVSFYKSDYDIPIEEVNSTIFSLERFQDALKEIVPSSKREGFCMVPSVTWEDVGALRDIKEELQETIIWPVKYRKLYENSGMESAKGILLYGPKGCGKTLLAKVIANECSINFLSVKGPELLNMYLGESERAVRQCFQRARNSAPCVIFFDEIDALCPERTGSNANAAAERVVNMLLTEMDGMEERNQVFVIGATNRLEKIDSAMLRPGRLEKIIYVGLPTPDDRVDILKSLVRTTENSLNKKKPKIANDIDLKVIGHDPRCDNFSGADLANLIRSASNHAMKEFLANSSTPTPDDIVEIKLRNFEHAFSIVRPSVSQKDIRHFLQISEQRQ